MIQSICQEEKIQATTFRQVQCGNVVHYLISLLHQQDKSSYQKAKRQNNCVTLLDKLKTGIEDNTQKLQVFQTFRADTGEFQ